MLPEPYYQNELVTLYHGDCREILPLLPKVDLVLTDPPYGVGFQYDEYCDTEEQFIDSVIPAVEFAVENAPTAVCMSMRQMHRLPIPRWVNCWHKPGSVRRSKIGGWSIWEPIFLYGDGWMFANDAITLPDCVNHDKGNAHPCPKPIRLFKWILGGHKGETILDPFAGSGTTLRAAMDLGRKCIGIEISEKYCEIAKKRLLQKNLQFAEVAS